jgi:SAM-dependent methyltransferase
MDRQTIEHYDHDAAATAARHRAVDQEVWRRQFTEAFSAGCRVFDVGAGSGRDLALLLSLGYDAHGCEPSAGMREEAVRAYPQLAGRLLAHALPFPEDVDLGGTYDAVVCSAVFMHIPEADAFDAAFSLRRVLKEGGRLWLTVPGQRPGLGSDDRDEHGRLFRHLHPEYLLLLFERLGFHLVRRWEECDRLGRPGFTWNGFLFDLDTVRGRPLDRIERVLNRDTKDATYKLALFRALSDLGTTQDHRAEWMLGSEVALPIGTIAEKWFRYYWPLFEAPDFIPQKNGEALDCAKPVAFRRQQMEIITTYRGRGGLTRFLLDHASGQLSPVVDRQYRETLRSIASTIRDGPVVFASGNMFKYDKTRRAVIVDASAWREFCQLGHWIEPAVLLRWAEETHRMSKQRVTVAEALNRLVVGPTEAREVSAAKQVFDSVPDKRCVWSDKPLRQGYAVDHVIPFSLWHCNDLWNLLPCDPRVNGAKSDKLPERALLLQRKDPVVYYWERARALHERRFDHELTNLIGTKGSGDWQNPAFQRLVEAVEVTALQRGAERWRP